MSWYQFLNQMGFHDMQSVGFRQTSRYDLQNVWNLKVFENENKSKQVKLILLGSSRRWFKRILYVYGKSEAYGLWTTTGTPWLCYGW